MKKIQISFLFISVVCAGYLHAQDLEEIAMQSFIESHCLAYAEVYRCFDMDESECRNLLSVIIPSCNKNPDEFPLSGADAETLAAFVNCINEAMILQVGSEVDLDTPCVD